MDGSIQTEVVAAGYYLVVMAAICHLFHNNVT
jgi:hypothetical protein